MPSFTSMRASMSILANTIHSNVQLRLRSGSGLASHQSNADLLEVGLEVVGLDEIPLTDELLSHCWRLKLKLQ